VPGIWYKCCGLLPGCCTGTVGVLRKNAETISHNIATAVFEIDAFNTATKQL